MLYLLSLIVNRIAHALSAWGGFLDGQQIKRINALLRNVRRFVLCGCTYPCDVPEYLMMTDCKFSKLFNFPEESSNYFYVYLFLLLLQVIDLVSK